MAVVVVVVVVQLDPFAWMMLAVDHSPLVPVWAEPHPLVDLGYSVTAVDNSADMLAYVKGAKAVCSDIEILDLNHRYDAVLLMSHMINIPDKVQNL